MFFATVTSLLPTTPSLSMIGLKKDAKEALQKDKEWPYKVSLVLTVIVHHVKGNMLVKLHAQCRWDQYDSRHMHMYVHWYGLVTSVK
jgi:hypothetical protein